MSEYKYGLTLSGGGVRGIAHIGAIRALHEFDIEPEIISGASAGAIVGALYAQGYTPDEMLEFFKKTKLFSWKNYSWLKPGFLDTDKFVDIFAEQLPEDDFESLGKKLYVVATDIENGEERVFEKGPLIQPILASAAFPVVFSPVEIDGKLFSDGGIVNNFPVELIRNQCDQLIGVFVGTMKKANRKDLDSTLEILERAYDLNLAVQSLRKMDQVDIAITPEKLAGYKTFDTRQIQDIHDIGYEAAKRVLDQLD